MNLSEEIQATLVLLPPALRALLEAELAAGNTISEVGHSHPAPPVGAYIRLDRAVTTRPRASGDGVDFYDRRGAQYSGEFTDAHRHFFILEPPHPPEPEPDMNATRAAMEARQREADLQRQQSIERDARAARRRAVQVQIDGPHAYPEIGASHVVQRFRASMELDYEKWREGTGYALDLIDKAGPEDRTAIEALLLGRGVRDWRDVEALARLDSPRTRALLRDTLLHASAELAAAVTRHAPDLASEGEKASVLVRALEETDFYGGLTQALMQVESFHPPAVVDALLRGVLGRTGGAQVHFAAMLLFIHGKSAAAFDWDVRPYVLQFNTTDSKMREALFRDLCEKLGIDPEAYVAGRDR